MNLIFETENFFVRRLKTNDFESFHEMQGNPNVMRFVRGKAMSYQEDKDELKKLILSYDNTANDFWIFAVERKIDAVFVGTVALVKSDSHGQVSSDDVLVMNIKHDECEIGYRLLEKFWGKGYAREITEGLIHYAKSVGFKRLIACVAYENLASVKILNTLHFQFMNDFTSESLKIPEKKLELYL